MRMRDFPVCFPRTKVGVAVDSVQTPSQTEKEKQGKDDTRKVLDKIKTFKSSKYDEMARELVVTTKFLSRQTQEKRKGAHDITTIREEPEHEIVDAKKRIEKLLVGLREAIVLSSDSLNLYSLQEILVSLSNLVRLENRSLAALPLYKSTVHVVWRRLEDSHAEQYLSPRRCLECIKVATVLQLPETPASFYAKLCLRLTEGDALVRLEPFELVQSLQWAAGRFFARVSNHDQEYQNCELPLLRATSRRLRKQDVRRKMNDEILMEAISATSVHLEQLKGNENVSSLIDELEMLAYTLLKERLSRLDKTALTTQETATLFRCGGLVLNGTDSIANRLVAALTSYTAMDQWTFSEASQIFDALTRWRHLNVSDAVQTIGYVLLSKHEESHPNPRQVNSIFRGVGLLYPDRPEVVFPYRKLAEIIFLDQKFLDNCNTRTLSNFVWFSSIAGLSGEAAEHLGECIIARENKFLDKCSPKFAGRILSSFTTLVNNRLEHASNDNENTGFRLRDILFRLFDTLGEHLLSTQLDPLDMSNALVAYAKSSYTMDPEIFDHLTASLASRLEECSVRQVAQSLWACGKMRNKDKKEKVPKYVQHACAMASYLSTKVSQLSRQDAVQCIWALARLQVMDTTVITALLPRIKEFVPYLTAVETGNCLWALSIVKPDAYHVIFLLTRHLHKEPILEEIKPHEAITVLYSLGRLNVRDELLFGKLSHLILLKVNDITSSSAIANVLWAHKMVGMNPPQAILDAWATKKLGLVPVSLMNQRRQ